MGGADVQHVAVPLTEREALPGMLVICGRPFPVIHIDGALGRLPFPPHAQSKSFLTCLVHFAPYPQIGKAVAIIGGMRAALELGHCKLGRIPGESSVAGGRRDRQAGILSNVGPGNSFRKIFVDQNRPAAGEILGASRTDTAGKAAEQCAGQYEFFPQHFHGTFFSAYSARDINFMPAVLPVPAALPGWDRFSVRLRCRKPWSGTGRNRRPASAACRDDSGCRCGQRQPTLRS